MKSVGKPDAGNPHVRFDERGEETERWSADPVTAPLLDSTQVHGNVSGWVADCWHPDLAGSPSDGSVWQPSVDACKQFTIRNGAFMNRADFLRSAHRGSASDAPEYAIGFRVARSLAD